MPTPSEGTETGVATHPVLAVPHKKGYLQIPNTIVFSLYPMLNVWQRAVYEELYLWTVGFGANPGLVSQRKIASRLNTDPKQIRVVMKQLAEKNLVETLGVEQGGAHGERGIWVRLWTPETEGRGTGASRPSEGRRPSQGRETSEGLRPHMKEIKKETHEKAPAAVAPAVDIFGIRTIAARLFEAHRSSPGFDHDRLRELVRDVLIGQGSGADEATIEEAIRGMGSS